MLPAGTNLEAVPGLGTDLALLFGLMALNSVFSLAEMAVVTARKSRLRQLAATSSRARAALELSESPDKFLSTIQLAITLIDLLMGVVAGWIGLSVGVYLAQVPWLAGHAETWGLTLTLISVTFVSILFGELIPKRIALVAPEKIALLVGVPMLWATKIVGPLVAVLVWLSTATLKLFRLNQHSQSEVSEEEIQMLVAESNEAGVIDDVERSMVNRVLTLGERTVSSLMTPRPRIQWLDAGASLEENLAILRSEPHSRYPVMRENDQEVLGVLESKWLLEHVGQPLDQAAPIDLFKRMIKPVFVPENMSAPNLIDQLRDEEVFMAFVVDEYGDLHGIVTLNDLLHAVLGSSSQPGPSTQSQITERSDGSYLVDGALGVDDLRELLEEAELPLEAEHDFHTLAGMLMAHFGRIPAPADSFDWRRWRFEVLDLDGARIDKVLISDIVSGALDKSNVAPT
jgi:putative hemolysin